MKLTIEHLAPYLPYNVNVFAIRDGKPSERYYLNAAYMEAILTIPDRHIIALRPLSDLIKEIEHNGERFIPIIRLLEIAHDRWIEDNKGTRYEETEYSGEGWYAKAWFKYSAAKDISIHKGFMWNEPLWKIQRLYQWHFDINGLIEKGLAVDINDLHPAKSKTSN